MSLNFLLKLKCTSEFFLHFTLRHSNMVAFGNGLFQDHPRKMFHLFMNRFPCQIFMCVQNESENYLENIGNANALQYQEIITIHRQQIVI